jgi:acyl dehydratase
MAVYQRLIVEAMWTRVAGIAGRSFQIRLSKPVRAGNKLTGRARITTITHRSERHDAVVIISSNITTEDGETVLAVVLDTLVAARPVPRALRVMEISSP